MRLGHASVLCGLYLLVAPATNAETHIVTQTGVAFDPPEITISVGDTIEWTWTSLAHTVTNGSGPSDPNVGVLFDAPLSSSAQTFSFTFDDPGDVPYFCRPHFGAGMVGVVHVIPAVPVDETNWSEIKDRYRD